MDINMPVIIEYGKINVNWVSKYKLFCLLIYIIVQLGIIVFRFLYRNSERGYYWKLH